MLLRLSLLTLAAAVVAAAAGPAKHSPPAHLSFIQEICGEESPSYSLFSGATPSPCFVHVFLFGTLYLVFIVCATVRLKQVVSLPMPAPRPLSHYQIATITLSSLVAGYNLILFAVLCAFDFGRPYQWFLFPVGCLTWFYCAVVLIAEAKYGLHTSWVLRTFWVVSFIFATFQLWADISTPSMRHTPFFTAFLVHYALFMGAAVAAIVLKESQTTYSQLPLDFNELTFDEEQIGAGDFFAGNNNNNASTTSAANALGRNVSTAAAATSASSQRSPARRLAMLFRREKWLLGGGLICCLIGAPIEVVQFIYIGLILDDVAIPEGPTAFTEYVGVLVMLYIVEAIASGVQLVLFMIAGERMACRLRRTIHTAVLRQEVAFLEAPGRVKDILERLDTDVACVQDAQTVQVSMWLQSMMQILVGSAFLFVLSWKLTLVALAVVPFIGLMMLAQATVMQSFSKRTMDWLTRVEDMGREIISNIRTVRTFARENKEKARYGAEVLEANRMAKRMAVAHGVSEGLGVFVLKMCGILGIFYAGSLVHHHELSGGVLVSFIFIALQVVMAFTVVPPLIGAMAQSLIAGQHVFELLDRKPDINMRGGLTLPSIEGRLEFKKVSFHAPSRPDIQILKKFSLLVEPNHTVALCGPPGSGKSTVLALAQRFFDPQEGLVLLDDTDISTFDPQWLRQQIGAVTHDPILFSSYTLSENIAYGLDARQEEIQQVAELVDMHETIHKIPHGGYRAIVGGPHVKLDRGQRQRIMIARVMLRNPKILLLDEPTLGLNPEAEALVQQALSRVTQGRSVLLIAHRLQPVRNSDLIAVMKKGQVIEAGDHMQLMSRPNGAYRMMWDREVPLESADWAEEDELSGRKPTTVASSRTMLAPFLQSKLTSEMEPSSSRGRNSRVAQLVDDLEREIIELRPGSGPNAISNEAYSILLQDLSYLKSSISS